MKWLDKKDESGQALVLIAFLMVVLLGFTALAIDGGRLFFLSRDAQNAADAAVIAGVYALCAGEDVQTAVEYAADLNGFNNLEDPNTVQTIHPYDIDGDGVDSPGKDDDYLKVIIDDSIDPTFAQLVYDGPLSVSVPAIGRCNPGISVAEIGAVFAGGEGCGVDAVDISGSQFVIVGGAHSNSGIDINGSGHTDTIDGDLNAVGVVDLSGVDPNDPNEFIPPTAANNGADLIPMPTLWDISDFAPDGDYAVIAQSVGEYYLAIDDSPPAGIITGLDEFENQTTNLEPDTTGDVIPPGIYYSPYEISNIDIRGLDGTSVTIVSPDQIDLNMDDSTYLELYNYDDHLGTALSDELGRMPVIFSTFGTALCNQMSGDYAIRMTPNEAYFTGVIYAPNGLIDFSVSQGGTGYGSLIGWLVDISASSFQLIYDPDLLPPIPPFGMLIE